MNKDRLLGAAEQAIGSVKQVVCKLTGDAKLQVDGTANCRTLPAA
jgi:uncharacterized protein YjbJ (UPF0337 family)